MAGRRAVNKSGLAMLKTLACITAVSFFTLYQSYDSYHYDINLTLNVLSFVSTIATPLYFLLSGYIDAGEVHTSAWQHGNIRRTMLIFITLGDVSNCITRGAAISRPVR